MNSSTAWQNRKSVTPCVSQDQELVGNYNSGKLQPQNLLKTGTSMTQAKFPTSLPSWSTMQLPTWKAFFLSSSYQPVDEPITSPRKLHSTAWLDGLRGVASLMVVIHHSSVLWYPELSAGWGSSPDNYHFVQLPIIRIFYAAGSAMVAIFFIVSGFSLSYKSLGLIRAGRFPGLLDSLSSSVFRRQLRLLLPPAATTFVSMIATYVGWYGAGPGSREPPRYESFWQNLVSWTRSVVELGDPFRPNVYPGGYNPTYDTNLWTIPVELHGSMVIFITVLGISKLHGRARLGLLVSIVLYLLYYVHTHLFLFLGGVLLAELHYIREERTERQRATSLTDRDLFDLDEPLTTEKGEKQNWSTAMNLFWIFNFLLALFVCCMPCMYILEHFIFLFRAYSGVV